MRARYLHSYLVSCWRGLRTSIERFDGVAGALARAVFANPLRAPYSARTTGTPPDF